MGTRLDVSPAARRPMRTVGRVPKRLGLPWLLLGIAALLACTEPARPMPHAARELHVFAASSFAEVLPEIAERYEASNPGVVVRLSFAGSQVLRTQIEQGARADLFLSASPEHVASLRDLGILQDVQTFAHNRLAVVVPKVTSKIQRFTDLADCHSLLIGTSSSPIGRYTRRMFDHVANDLGEAWVTHLKTRIVSEESNVRLLRAKVALGVAEAAIVYRTEGRSSADVRHVEIPERWNVDSTAQIGIVARSSSLPEAQQFLSDLRTPAVRDILQRAGFEVGAP
jgi:molybdate transport system substrate-binding protein